jgi:hypothetical protein
MREAIEWLRRYERFWSESLDRLATYAEAHEAKARAGEAAERKRGSSNHGTEKSTT